MAAQMAALTVNFFLAIALSPFWELSTNHLVLAYLSADSSLYPILLFLSRLKITYKYIILISYINYIHINIGSKKIDKKHLLKHETKRHVLLKFLLVLSIFLGYFLFITYKYGIQQGFLVSLLSWSFFVLSTPVADAGFLIDFPLRLVTKIKMIFSEMLVWLIAISINIYAIISKPEIYETSKLLSLFKKILIQPFPFWAIIILSFLGTFVSIHFGDELLDKTKHSERKIYQKHKKKYKLFIMFFIFSMTLVIYEILLKQLNITISL